MLGFRSLRHQCGRFKLRLVERDRNQPAQHSIRREVHVLAFDHHATIKGRYPAVVSRALKGVCHGLWATEINLKSVSSLRTIPATPVIPACKNASQDAFCGLVPKNSDPSPRPGRGSSA